MAAIKGRDTKPEILVRKMVHRMGYRFRLHRKDLPGKPDLVFPRLRKIIFVHGCFWHKHKCPAGSKIPAQNFDFWEHKRQLNKERDKRTLRSLRRAGWSVLILWECKLKKKHLNDVRETVSVFLDEQRRAKDS